MAEDLNSDLHQLQNHLDGMLDRVRHNSIVLRRFQSFERRLLDINALPELIAHILETGKTFFNLDTLSFCLLDPDGQLAAFLSEDGFDIAQTRALILLEDDHWLKTAFGLTIKPYIGPYQPLHGYDWFPDVDKKPCTVALIPLVRRGKYLGSLNFGSYQTDRFLDEMATDFVEHLVSVVSICLENNLNFEVLRRTSFIDTLTGVNNRRFLEQRMSEEIDRSLRSGESLSCLFLDIDYFKSINDNYGHQAGDHVLAVIAGAIKNLLRNNDVLARYGGEEFVALLSNLDETRLQAIAERIRVTVQALNIKWENTVIQTTLSIGIATYSAPSAPVYHAADIGVRLIEAADDALYRAKHNGRNRIESNGLINIALLQFKKIAN